MIDEGRPSLSLAWTAWSLRLGRIRGVTVRASWTLGLLMVISVYVVIHASHPELIPLALIIPPGVVVLHFLGHALALRLLGCSAESTVLGMLGDQTTMSLPLRPWPQFFAASGGPLASLALWALCNLALRLLHAGSSLQPSMFGVEVQPSAIDPLVAYSIVSTAGLSMALFLWNLIPSIVFDGGRMWRGALWPLLGLSGAIRSCLIIAFICSAYLFFEGAFSRNPMMFIVGISLLLSTLMEWRSFQSGYDLVLEVETGYGPARRGGNLLLRWQQRRRIRRQERDEREEASEQETLDRLLAKVSAEGLPSLTSAERESLQRISKKQKARQQHQVPTRL